MLWHNLRAQCVDDEFQIQAGVLIGSTSDEQSVTMLKPTAELADRVRNKSIVL